MPGISTYALGLLLPDGDDRFVALFTVPPDPDGTGGAEVIAAGYARVAHDAWLTIKYSSTDWRRVNSGAVEFAAFELPPEAGRLEAVGIYDAATDGNLLLFARCTPIENIAGTDQVRFTTGQLAFGAVP